MNISELCIRRPVMTTLVMLSFVIFGAFAFRQLPVAALPNVDFPTISVYATLPGASAETMASSVAAPLERQFATISGVSSMTSSSSIGSDADRLAVLARPQHRRGRARRAIGDLDARRANCRPSFPSLLRSAR